MLGKFSTVFSTGRAESFPQFGQKLSVKYGENLKYFLLDIKKKGCIIHLQSKVLTGVWPEQGKASRAVTHCLRTTKRRKKVVMTPWIEAERLAQEKVEKLFRVTRIKTGNTFWQGTTRKEQKSLRLRKQVKPRCRERNRRWRKSHHNKNLSAR